VTPLTGGSLSGARIKEGAVIRRFGRGSVGRYSCSQKLRRVGGVEGGAGRWFLEGRIRGQAATFDKPPSLS
jgi:hypothetical protein